MRLSRRLLSVASYLRGVCLFDVGTDHAYLPIYAVSFLGIPYAEASDLLPGPLETAGSNIRKNGLNGKIKTVLRYGLDGAVLPEECDVVISGMGGELIAEIISSCPALKNRGIRLVLQPMTKPEVLRRYLAENGFDVIRERIVEDRQLYSVIVSEYSGKKKSLSSLEELIGDPAVHDDKAALCLYAEKKAESLSDAVAGKNTAGLETGPETELIKQLRMLCSNEHFRTV